MMQIRDRGDTRPFVVELTEWDQIGPVQEPRLRGYSLAADKRLHQLAETLRGRLDIREGYEGLEISSTSFVGRVDFGPFSIAIGPKLPAMPLAQLLRYAYGLRDLRAFEETRAPTTQHGFHDLLISLLAAEVEELLHRGLARRYVPLSEKLESPRGRILVDQLIREGGVREAKLPCGLYQRRADWHLNRVLRAGLEGAARLTQDHELRRGTQRLSSMFCDVERLGKFGADDVSRAERELTRLTDACRPALTIIRLLLDMQGVTFDSPQRTEQMPGFLFDMNIFFERLLSRFLRENLSDAYIKDQEAIRSLFAYAPEANPRKRRAPTPRPDYALYRDSLLSGFLDAKYRDIWDRNLPPEWLYQLAIYALASPCDVSVLLYASISAGASDERIEVRQPVPNAGRRPASVILRPVDLRHLAWLVCPERADSAASERRDYARYLTAFKTGERYRYAA